MSVYIKGFPLPNNCGACPLRLAWCRERIYMVTRPERCPLIPVPEHGRLIDGDKLGIREAEKQAYEAYLREKAEFFREEPLLEYMRGRLEGLTDASGRVRFAPTIIPASKEGEG